LQSNDEPLNRIERLDELTTDCRGRQARISLLLAGPSSRTRVANRSMPIRFNVDGFYSDTLVALPPVLLERLHLPLVGCQQFLGMPEVHLTTLYYLWTPSRTGSTVDHPLVHPALAR
jgi:hypothetical protein